MSKADIDAGHLIKTLLMRGIVHKAVVSRHPSPHCQGPKVRWLVLKAFGPFVVYIFPNLGFGVFLFKSLKLSEFVFKAIRPVSMYIFQGLGVSVFVEDHRHRQRPACYLCSRPSDPS